MHLDWRETEIGKRVIAAIDRDARLAELAPTCEVLAELTEKGAQGDESAYALSQQIMYALHDSVDPATEAKRRLICEQMYLAQERHIPRVTLGRRLSSVEFLDKVSKTLSGRSRVEHPMSQYLFGGHPSLDEIRVFLRHQWFRTCKLYQDASDLVVRLYADVTHAAALYRYLYGEAGEDDPSRAHPTLLQVACRHLNVACSFEERTRLFEEMVYLNNRRRSFRTPNPAWGLAVFYITEIVVSSNHKKLYQMLVDADLPDEATEYYRVHIALVPPRAKREWSMIEDFLDLDDFQETFLTSLQQHLAVESAYYDAIWREVQAIGNNRA